ncbi:MAG: hypothetical protein N2050_05575 [Flavobacteriales bacterium]|nr:hypothetical protein [Flavobacteriales bacterium]MCX7650005.1 hypothetical protein [Flavobacteriales bacterium]MDW8432014.1 hypothetical protein [Flavobacteriales bacterium]
MRKSRLFWVQIGILAALTSLGFCTCPQKHTILKTIKALSQEPDKAPANFQASLAWHTPDIFMTFESEDEEWRRQCRYVSLAQDSSPAPRGIICDISESRWEILFALQKARHQAEKGHLPLFLTSRNIRL